jgi:hypothetical protein
MIEQLLSEAAPVVITRAKKQNAFHRVEIWRPWSGGKGGDTGSSISFIAQRTVV